VTDFRSVAQQTNERMIVAGIDEMYRLGRDETAGQNLEDHRALRLLANIYSLLPEAGLARVRSVLEVGCGAGHVTKWLMAMAPEVTAFDASEEAIRHAKARSKTPEVFRVGDGIFPERVVDRRFDLVLLSEFHPFKRGILPDASPADYDAFYAEVMERYIALLNRPGLIVVFHGINQPHPHIDPRRLRLSLPAVEFSARRSAIESLARNARLTAVLDRALVSVTRRRVTCFYVAAPPR
jgi:SAM-dependent methyltransferase